MEKQNKCLHGDISDSAHQLEEIQVKNIIFFLGRDDVTMAITITLVTPLNIFTVCRAMLSAIVLSVVLMSVIMRVTHVAQW